MSSINHPILSVTVYAIKKGHKKAIPYPAKRVFFAYGLEIPQNPSKM
jgi:hypothetical protein